jgi:diguanylate cyclase (GGDEF)-like protein
VAELQGGTVLLLNSAVSAVMFLALRAMRRALLADARAVGSWSVGYAFFALSALCYFFRGTLPPIFSMVFAGTLFCSGIVIIARGFFRFYARDLSPALVYGAMVALFAAHLLFSYVIPDYVMRVMLIAITGVIAQSAVLRLYALHAARPWRIGERLAILALLVAFTAYALRLGGLIGEAFTHQDSLQQVGDGPFFFGYLVLLNVAAILLANAILVLTQERVARKLQDLVAHDELTGALSRRVILDTLEVARNTLGRHDDHWAVIMIDLDRFKAVNDTHGHAIGDELLLAVVRTLRENLRLDSHLGRYGGEEFLVVARLQAAGEGLQLAERLRAAVAGREYMTSAGPLRCTISAGVAELDRDRLARGQDPLRAADAALYEARRSGRNRSCVARDPGTAAGETAAAGAAGGRG